MKLVDRLQQAATCWATTNDRSLPHLATRVANDGKTFVRLAEGKTCTLELFERFRDFLLDPGNWPATGVPDSVTGLLLMPVSAEHAFEVEARA